MHLARCRGFEGTDKTHMSLSELSQKCFGADSNTGEHVASINTRPCGHSCRSRSTSTDEPQGALLHIAKKELVQEFIFI